MAPRLDDRALLRLRAALREPDFSSTKYRLAGVAGSGGMGTVYVVEDTDLRRRVALKVLDLPDADLEARLRREAQVLARLEHPGIVPVHDVGVLPDGRTFYTMKWVEGARLDRHLAARCPWPSGSGSSCASPMRWRSPTQRECCTATSSPRT